MMFKDEVNLLEPWLVYYGELFGYSNLYVWDNGSTEDSIHQLLRRYRELGVHIIYTAQSGIDYRRKGVLLGKKIFELQAGGSYDFFIPVDCDEFLILQDGDSLKYSPSDIINEISRYTGMHGVLGINACYNNIPNGQNIFYKSVHRKSFFYAGSFKQMDKGYHHAETHGSHDRIDTKLAYIHYHNKPLSLLKKSAEAKLRPVYGDLSMHFLEEIAPNNRLARQLLQNEEEYLNYFTQVTAINLSSYCDYMKSIGASVQFFN